MLEDILSQENWLELLKKSIKTPPPPPSQAAKKVPPQNFLSKIVELKEPFLLPNINKPV